jgi:uncharacterized phage-associated protein
MKRFKFDPNKFRELVVYVAKKSEDDPHFGALKLNKILYYADFIAYRRRGQPITGATYQKLQQGPAPKQLLKERDVLVDAGEITIEARERFTKVQQRVVAKRQPKTSHFDPDELDIVDEVIEELWQKNGREVSELSHKEAGWRAVGLGQKIPYETAWISNDPPLEEEEAYGRQVAARLASGR